jgi:hypothetical protein
LYSSFTLSCTSFLVARKFTGPKNIFRKAPANRTEVQNISNKIQVSPLGKKKKTKPKSKIKIKTTQITMRLAREQRRDVAVGDEARRSIQVLLNLTQDHGRINMSKECKTLRRSISRQHTK